jgi:hypothetical protein
MRVRHPYTLEADAPPVDSYVHIGGRRNTHPVDDDGVIWVAGGVSRSAVASWAAGYGYELTELIVDDGESDDSDASNGADADAMLDNGVCPWCDEYAGNHVGQHASSAHPDEWDEYTD